MTASSLTKRLRDLVGNVHSIRIGSYEESELGTLKERLVPSVLAVLATGVELFGDVLHLYEADYDETSVAATDPSTSFCEEVDAALAEPGGAERISSIAFMGRWELSQKESSLRHREGVADVWGLIELCGSARRKLLKSGIALETAICEHEGLESELREISITEVQRSLQTRKAYRKLRSVLLADGPPDAGNLESRLKSVAQAIAHLVLEEVYSDLRVTDRMELRKLRRRLQEHLSGKTELENDDALHLWEDLASFSELLRLVNHRAQLLDHDRRVMTSLIRDIEKLDAPELPPPAETVERANDLLGRADEIDELLLCAQETPARVWLDTLRQALAQLDRHDGTDERQYAGEHAISG